VWQTTLQKSSAQKLSVVRPHLSRFPLPVWYWLKYTKQQQRIINIIASLCLAGYSFTAGGPASSSCPIRVLRTGRRSLSARTHVSSAVWGLEQVQIGWLRLKVDLKIERLFFVLSGIVLFLLIFKKLSVNYSTLPRLACSKTLYLLFMDFLVGV